MDWIMVAIVVLALLTGWLLIERAAALSGSSSNKEEKGNRGGARIMPDLYMDQLDSKADRYINRFELNEGVLSSEDGYVVYGCGAGVVPENGLKLHHCAEAEYVDAEGHAVIFKDGDGYYIQNKNDENGMRLSGHEERIERVAIEDGMVLFFGMQPIRFLFVNHAQNWRAGRAAVNQNPNVRNKPQRRNKPGAAR